jgi:anti-sigma28 factor (negative regulator of flagellin synthesis)
MRIETTKPIEVTTQSSTTARKPAQRQDSIRLSIPDNSEKLDRLEAALQSGSYRISASQIASSMIEEMLAA